MDYFDDFNTWTTELEQDQVQDQILAEIQGQELDTRDQDTRDQDTRDQDTRDQDTRDQDTRDQDTRPQKRRYLSSISPEPTGRRYPLRKRQLTVKAAALIID